MGGEQNRSRDKPAPLPYVLTFRGGMQSNLSLVLLLKSALFLSGLSVSHLQSDTLREEGVEGEKGK